MPLVLASRSPRRTELLGSLGLSFTCHSGQALDEAGLLAAAPGSIPERLIRLARAKGAPVAAEFPTVHVLSADTEVVLDGAFLGKPADRLAAVEMLQRLAGRMHEVFTAVALQCPETGLDLAACECTRVYFGVLSQAQIEHYVERAQPFDYAGGYAIQGLGALLVERIEGDYSNVVGLPLRLTAQLLHGAGYDIL
jgi:septum formation protein